MHVFENIWKDFAVEIHTHRYYRDSREHSGGERRTYALQALRHHQLHHRQADPGAGNNELTTMGDGGEIGHAVYELLYFLLILLLYYYS